MCVFVDSHAVFPHKTNSMHIVVTHLHAPTPTPKARMEHSTVEPLSKVHWADQSIESQRTQRAAFFERDAVFGRVSQEDCFPLVDLDSTPDETRHLL